MLCVRDEQTDAFPERTVADFLAIGGQLYREAPGRRTLRFERNGRSFFIKCHANVGWQEVWKNLLSLRLPVISARPEWRALRKLESLGVGVPRWVAFGVEGWSPASRRSFLVTEEVHDLRDLEYWAKEINHHSRATEALKAKWALIDKVGRLTRTLHSNGINHRDLYLCHLHLQASRQSFFENPSALPIQVMDLHRAQIRRRTPQRWLAKDLEGLLYSCQHGPAELGLTSRDVIRFLRAYRDDWRASLVEEKRLWQLVLRRFRRSHRRQFGCEPLRPPLRLRERRPRQKGIVADMAKPAILRFPILLTESACRGEPLRCEEILRALPGRRVAFRGYWGNKAVFVKQFSGGRREARHWRREKQALGVLRNKDISVPRLLHAGMTTGSEHVLVTEYISGIQTVEGVWQNAVSASLRRSMTEQMVQLFARHHERGALHTDPHLANFAVPDADAGIVTLDAGAVRLRNAPIGRRAAIRNLGLLLAQFPDQAETDVSDMHEAYARARGWEPAAKDRLRITEALRKAKAWRRRKYLSKIFRNCSAVVCRRSATRRLVCDRSAYRGEMRELLADPDTYLEKSQTRILKAGNSSTVALIDVNGEMLAVKRYNLKSWRHALSRALRPTRAARSWYNAHALAFEGIPTARPIACLEKRLGPFRRQSYLVTEYVPGPTCQQYFSDQESGEVRDHDAVALVTVLLRRLHALQLEHGDMKASNIIMAEQGPVLVDLDAMHRHRSPRRFQRAARQERERLQLNWTDLPAVRVLFEEGLGKPSAPSR